ncbi:hypothetical protein NMY22_g17201 [Coprinellus aureogranulatus]|nr:hypothetical protein NMY22_g17201 [Coprinellus aureogranulatus]
MVQTPSQEAMDHPTPSIPNLTIKHVLSSHCKAVGALTISPDHAYLMSAGDDSSLIVWDLGTGLPLQVIKVALHGPIQSAVWVYSTRGVSPRGLVFGCADGTVHYYKKEPTSFEFLLEYVETLSPPSPVEVIAFDPFRNYVGIASGGRCSLWRLGRQGLIASHSSDPQTAMITSLFFLNQGGLLVASYLESHEMIAYETESFEEAWKRTLRTRIGHAVAGPNNTILVSNLVDGVDVYTNPPTRLLRTLPYGKHDFTLQLSAFPDGALAIVGSEQGRPMVFNSDGSSSHALMHESALVPTVTSSQLGPEYYVAAAAAGDPYHIKVWYAKESGPSLTRSGNAERHHSFTFSLQQLLLIVCLAILVQMLFSHLSHPFHVANIAQEMLGI